MPDMLGEVRARTAEREALTSPEFPIGLSAGERRAYTANDILRDLGWRKRDADGALRIRVQDASALNLRTGDRARITTAAGTAEAGVEATEAMLPGHASLPNGSGWSTSMPTAPPGFPVSHRTRSRRATGVTHTRAQACTAAHRNHELRRRRLIPATAGVPEQARVAGQARVAQPVRVPAPTVAVVRWATRPAESRPDPAGAASAGRSHRFR